MWMRFFLPLFVIALATPCYADEKGIINIGDGITSYRLTAQFCNWPIPPSINADLNRDEAHFTAKNAKAFRTGVKAATVRFEGLKSYAGYCAEIKASRNEMTKSLQQPVK